MDKPKIHELLDGLDRVLTQAYASASSIDGHQRIEISMMLTELNKLKAMVAEYGFNQDWVKYPYTGWPSIFGTPNGGI